MIPKRICIDMDGVLFDFVKAAAQLFGPSEEDLRKIWEPGEFEVFKPLGITEDELWRRVAEVGIDHWANMEPFPWALDLWNLCMDLTEGHAIVLSSPSRDPVSLAGKLKRLQTWHPEGENFRRYLIGPKKEYCASPDTLLIDDADKNCDKFVAAGGQAILFPRYWNSRHEYEADAFAFTKECLEHAMLGQDSGWGGP